MSVCIIYLYERFYKERKYFLDKNQYSHDHVHMYVAKGTWHLQNGRLHVL